MLEVILFTKIPFWMPWALARGEERKGTHMRAKFASLAGGRFGGTERPNHARKGLCDAGIAPQLLSAMLASGTFS